MIEATLEERVARLERLVDGLIQGRNRCPAPGRDWRDTVGMFGGDPVFKEMIQEAFRQREEERRRACEEENRERS